MFYTVKKRKNLFSKIITADYRLDDRSVRICTLSLLFCTVCDDGGGDGGGGCESSTNEANLMFAGGRGSDKRDMDPA